MRSASADGIEHCRQSRPALVVLLLTQRPRLVLDNVFVDRRDQAPRRFQCARKLKLIEERSEFRDRLARRLRDRIIACCSSTPRATDTAPRL